MGVAGLTAPLGERGAHSRRASMTSLPKRHHRWYSSEIPQPWHPVIRIRTRGVYQVAAHSTPLSHCQASDVLCGSARSAMNPPGSASPARPRTATAGSSVRVVAPTNGSASRRLMHRRGTPTPSSPCSPLACLSASPCPQGTSRAQVPNACHRHTEAVPGLLVHDHVPRVGLPTRDRISLSRFGE